MKLEAQALRFAWAGEVLAVDGVQLEWRAPGLISLIGPNGSGKSTLLRLLAGLLEPQAGRVLLDGAPLPTHAPKRCARAIALLPQYLPRLPEVRVQDFVLSGRYAHLEQWNRVAARDLEAVRRALVECDLIGLEQRSMAELSGGQRQRVLIARALAQEAAVLLFDEPTNALDPEHQVQVLELLEAQRRLGRLVVAATHDLNLAAQYSTQVVLMHAGRIAASGTVLEVMRPSVLGPVYGAHLSYDCAGGEAGAYPVVRALRPQGSAST